MAVRSLQHAGPAAQPGAMACRRTPYGPTACGTWRAPPWLPSGSAATYAIDHAKLRRWPYTTTVRIPKEHRQTIFIQYVKFTAGAQLRCPPWRGRGPSPRPQSSATVPFAKEHR